MPLGALVADALYRSLGYGAWVSFVAMVLVVLVLAGRLVVDRAKAVGGIAAMGFTMLVGSIFGAVIA